MWPYDHATKAYWRDKAFFIKWALDPLWGLSSSINEWFLPWPAEQSTVHIPHPNLHTQRAHSYRKGRQWLNALILSEKVIDMTRISHFKYLSILGLKWVLNEPCTGWWAEENERRIKWGEPWECSSTWHIATFYFWKLLVCQHASVCQTITISSLSLRRVIIKSEHFFPNHAIYSLWCCWWCMVLATPRSCSSPMYVCISVSIYLNDLLQHIYQKQT